ncbi:MAG: hypothetical protein IJ025_02260 [Clostridia bacterium]|nr:hypothetical protein [Clostridia bacterium]
MNKNEFQYTYSASQKKEIKKIREKYAPTTEHTDKMTLLRKLDKTAERPGTIISLILGILGALVFGVGLVCVMVWTQYFIPGIFIGVAGIMILSAAYPVYKKITAKKRKNIAPEILQLIDELEK